MKYIRFDRNDRSSPRVQLRRRDTLRCSFTILWHDGRLRRCWPFRGANYRISRQSVRVEDAIISAVLFAWNNLFKNYTRNDDWRKSFDKIPKKNFAQDRSFAYYWILDCILIRDNEIKASYHVLWCSKYKKNSTYIIRIFIKDVRWKLESSFHFSMLWEILW